MSDETFCYVASQAGMPGYFWAAVDRPEWAARTAKDVAKYVREGYTVTRVRLDEAQAGFAAYMDAKDALNEPQP